MAITSAMPTSFKKELFIGGIHAFGDASASPHGGDNFDLVLIKATPAGTYGAATTNYTDVTGNSDEAVDSSSPQGYSSGGGRLTKNGASSNSTSGIVDFADISFTAVTLSADGALIKNASSSNKACGVYSFGSTKTASGGNFDITMPAAAAGTAVLEIA